MKKWKRSVASTVLAALTAACLGAGGVSVQARGVPEEKPEPGEAEPEVLEVVSEFSQEEADLPEEETAITEMDPELPEEEDGILLDEITVRAARDDGEELLVDGDFENQNASGAWTMGSGCHTIYGNAASGDYYMETNGSAHSWGDGASQTIAYTQGKNYILTGSAYVIGSLFWVGVKVGGKEIYAVFSTGSYTDTTDTPDKQAAAVYSNATSWTEFTIRFTAESITGTNQVYTWANYGSSGYVDNLSLKEAPLFWDEFDALMAQIETLQETEYTVESWTAFQAVVEEAKAFRESPDVNEQSQITDMTNKLQEALAALVRVDEAVGGHIYYVDEKNGNDSNDGLSPETAWKTLKKASSVRWMHQGGALLMRSGCVWTGEHLTVKEAAGTEKNPVIIGSYYVNGDEPVIGVDAGKPVINGNGGNWDYDTKEELAAVHIYNSENIVVENLEITNWDETASAGSYTYGQSGKLLSGLVVENQDAGELHNVTVRNNKIHEVNGKMAGGASKASGGLIVVATGSSGQSGRVQSWYNGLTIEGNEVSRVCHEAIYMESVWAARTLVGGSSSQDAGKSGWVGSSNVTIRNNYVHDVAGDGIVPINTTDCLVEYNLVDNSADTNWNYNPNPNHAGLWTWDTDNVTFRYNEVCNTSKKGISLVTANDSMAFDFDYGVQNCLYEYNYSHNNFGGFLMTCPGPGATVNGIARYNVSVNDGGADGAVAVRLGRGKYGTVGVQIYNNTMYWEDNGGYKLKMVPYADWAGSVLENVSVYNNIFYGPVQAGTIAKISGVTYSHNLACSSDGSAESLYATVADDGAVLADPAFVDTNGFTFGSWSEGATTIGTADGFKLQETSPAIDAGREHPETPNFTDNAGYLTAELVTNTMTKADRDYAGTALSDGINDIGAFEYAGTVPVIVDKSQLEELVETSEAAYTEDRKDDYTAESWASYEKALADAKAVLEDPEASQEDVDAAYQALQEAVESLTKAETEPEPEPEPGEPGTEEPGEPGTEEPGEPGTEEPGPEEPGQGGSGSEDAGEEEPVSGGSGSLVNDGSVNVSVDSTVSLEGSGRGEGNEAEKEQAVAAKTGDPNSVWPLLLLMAVSASSAAAVLLKRQKRKK